MKINQIWVHIFTLLTVLLMVSAGVIAFGTNSPSDFGHSPSEIDWTQQIPGSVSVSGNLAVGSVNANAASVSGAVSANQLCLNGDCITNWDEFLKQSCGIHKPGSQWSSSQSCTVSYGCGKGDTCTRSGSQTATLKCVPSSAGHTVEVVSLSECN